MNRKNRKVFIDLLFVIYVSELLNKIIYVCLYAFIYWLYSKSYILLDSIDIICSIGVVLCSLLSYFVIGKKFFSQIEGDNAERKIAIILAVIYVIKLFVIIKVSFLLYSHFMILGSIFYTLNCSVCSPFAYLVISILSIGNIPSFISMVIFSPISVVLIWLFSKIKTRKKPDNIEDEYLS